VADYPRDATGPAEALSSIGMSTSQDGDVSHVVLRVGTD
jgi:hypothetical protein